MGCFDVNFHFSDPEMIESSQHPPHLLDSSGNLTPGGCKLKIIKDNLIREDTETVFIWEYGVKREQSRLLVNL